MDALCEICAATDILHDTHRVKLDVVALRIERTLCQGCSAELGQILAQFFGIPRQRPTPEVAPNALAVARAVKMVDRLAMTSEGVNETFSGLSVRVRNALTWNNITDEQGLFKALCTGRLASFKAIGAASVAEVEEWLAARKLEELA